MDIRIQPQIISRSSSAKQEKEEKKVNEEENTTSSQTDVKPKATTQVDFDLLEGKEKSESENWLDIAKEWKAFVDANWNDGNLPDADAYIAYFEKYIEYMDRILACDNLPEEEKAEYERMKNNATRDLENNKKDKANEEWLSIAREWKSFAEANWNDGYFPSYEARVEYFEKYIDYMDKILDCDSLPDENRAEYERMKENATRDLENTLREGNGESNYQDVLKEIDTRFSDINNIPTLTGKRIAKALIQKLLKCEDIPSMAKIMYSNILETLENDIKQMRLDSGEIF